MEKPLKKSVFIKSKSGKISVENVFFKNKKPLIILVHGFNSKKNSRIMLQLRDFFNKKKISTMSVDLFGHGKSYGLFEDFTISRGVESLSAVLKYARKKFGGKIGLFATSMGGLVALLSLKSERVDFLMLRSPVIEKQGDIIANYHKLNLDDWKKTKIAIVNKVGTFFKLKYEFYTDAQKYNALDLVDSFNMPVFICHGDKDDFVPYDTSMLFSKSVKEITFIPIKGATHSFSDSDVKIMLDKIMGFLEKYKFL